MRIDETAGPLARFRHVGVWASASGAHLVDEEIESLLGHGRLGCLADERGRRPARESLAWRRTQTRAVPKHRGTKSALGRLSAHAQHRHATPRTTVPVPLTKVDGAGGGGKRCNKHTYNVNPSALSSSVPPRACFCGSAAVPAKSPVSTAACARGGEPYV